MKDKRYCTPNNAGLSSQSGAVARRIGKLLDALDDQVTSWVVDAHNGILADIDKCRDNIRNRLESEGWTVGYTDGNLDASNRCKVYPPGSPTGEKIRKWRAER